MKRITLEHGPLAPISDEDIAAAIERGNAARQSEPGARCLSYDEHVKALQIGLADGSMISLPVKNFPEFANLSSEHLKQVVLGDGGNAIYLDECDLHVSIAGMLGASAPLMRIATALVARRNGAISTPAKADAARQNGRRGGRPRKTSPTA